MPRTGSNIECFESRFTKLTDATDLFLCSRNKEAENFKELTKSIYDETKTWETKSSLTVDDALPELIIQGFDEEQVWQQIELQNEALKNSFLQKLSTSISKKFFQLRPKAVEKDYNSTENEQYSSEDDALDIDEVKTVVKRNSSKRQKIDRQLKRTSVVDDKFFKIDELEDYLKAEESSDAKRIDDDSNEVDLFADPEMSDENVFKSGREARYEDFFDPPHGDGDHASEENSCDENEENDDVEMNPDDREDSNDDKNGDFEINSDGEEYDTRDFDPSSFEDQKTEKKSLLISSDSEDEEVVESAFQKRQKKLNKKINELEASNLSEKPWQLKGEIAAGSRPENSLLQEHLLFDHTTSQAPVITEETTATLEDLIKCRIKDQAWDDVTRKEKPKEEPFEYRKRLMLSQEKSKESLAQIYEQEYIKQHSKDNEDESKELPEHREIRKMMSSLFSKLDALANYHFTPKPAVSEIKVVSNLPAITVEEVAPVSVSDGALLAPEEIKMKTKGVLKGSSERTKEDQKHDRRKSKTKTRLRKKEKSQQETLVAKLNPGLGNKYSKQEALKKLANDSGATTIIKDGSDRKKSKSMSSKSFFTNLQDKVTTEVNKIKKKANESSKKNVSSARMKL